MLKLFQIVTLAAITIVCIITLPSAWISISPEMGFSQFLSQASVLSPIATIATTALAAWAFILGWDPTQKALQTARTAVIKHLLQSTKFMAVITVVCICLGALLILHYYSIKNDKEEIINLVLQENFDAADIELAKLSGSAANFSDLYVITNAMRQLTRNAGKAGDQTECRIHLNFLENRSTLFQPLWTRYLIQHSKSACLQVLDNPSAAAVELEKARQLAGWLSEYENRRVSRDLARLYLQDKVGAGIKDKDERLRRIVSLISTDPEKSAIRMLGTARFEQGDYSQAIELWSKSLSSENNVKEIKRLNNNIGLGYLAMAQPERAIGIVMAALNSPFSELEEDQRREQIRLMATGASIQSNRKRCSEALDLWGKRTALMHQDKPKCGWLIEAQILNCVQDGQILEPSKREGIIQSLVRGIGQNPEDFKDRTASAINELITQADLRFKECYVGLKFHPEEISKSLLSPPVTGVVETRK